MAHLKRAASVQSGPAIIVSSGTATTFCGEALSVHVPMLDGSLFVLIFRCSVDPEVDGVQLAHAVHPSGFELALVNFTDGRGSAVPVPLGQIGEYNFHLHFRVFRWGETVDHSVQWTLFAVPV